MVNFIQTPFVNKRNIHFDQCKETHVFLAKGGDFHGHWQNDHSFHEEWNQIHYSDKSRKH